MLFSILNDNVIEIEVNLVSFDDTVINDSGSRYKDKQLPKSTSIR